MAMTDKPKARQSQLVTTYGIGSLFPSGDQSFMIAGLDDWDERWCAEVEEPRLARSLRVRTFRAPATGKRSGDVPAIRFPTYHYCPNCRRLDRYWKFNPREMRCDDCERDLTPSRFVACCESGHIEDFPYFQWVHRGQSTTSGQHSLKLTTKGASSSLADIVISCSCGVHSHDLDGSFSPGALAQIKSCGGKRPWLPGAEDETCERPLRVLQRGSSNVWFAEVRSSISIPPWSSPNAQFVARNWTMLEHVPTTALADAVAGAIRTQHTPGLTLDGILAIVRQRKGLDPSHVPTDQELRAEEYRALIDGNDRGAHDTFQCTAVDVAADLDGIVAQVSKATRLREVRALQGFSRVTPTPTTTTRPQIAQLSQNVGHWLPATEVLGEGIFVQLDQELISDWEKSEPANARREMLAKSLKLRATESGSPGSDAPSARFLLIHSLAHALLKELSLDAGYPVGSLRERIYADPDQAGVLIYTASSDAAGSLGGLAALADGRRFARVLRSAISRASWCSNDPVCSESGPSGTDGLNLASCHACLLLPETSCEHRNIFLDRVALVGTIDAPLSGALHKVLG
ncbi:DUF1998 domain-containing protein [Sinomonas flava]|uniref:DUF1998 domain-containing protein n=1 Tax=Sinomonas flava TaxID=496857 RepID=A0ABN3BSR8_9MICC